MQILLLTGLTIGRSSGPFGKGALYAEGGVDEGNVA